MTDKLTDIEKRLGEIREREAKATDGPWKLWRGPHYVGGGEDICIGQGDTWLANMDHRCRPHTEPLDGWAQVGECDILTINSDIITQEQMANADFIAHARTDIPFLLAQLEAARREVGAVKDVLGELLDAHDLED